MMYWWPSMYSGIPDYETFVGLFLNLHRRENVEIFIATEAIRNAESGEATSMELLKEMYSEGKAGDIRLRQKVALAAARARAANRNQ